MTFGKKIVSIRGSLDYCVLTFENGNSMKCCGELFPDRFAIYRRPLKLSPEEVETLRKMIEDHGQELENALKITIE